MEIRNGLVQPRRRQAGKLLLEAAKSVRGLVGLFRGGCSVVAVSVLNKVVGAPGFSLRVFAPVAAVARRNQRERAAVTVRFAGKLRTEMRRDAFNILHHRGGRVEDLGVDVLQDVAHPSACPVARNQVGVVDVAVAVGHKVHGLAAELELRGYGKERFATSIDRFAHGHSFSG
jgi:hypothetical protein